MHTLLGMDSVPQQEPREEIGEVLRRVEAGESLTVSPADVAAAISVAARAELHVGALVTADDDASVQSLGDGGPPVQARRLVEQLVDHGRP